MTQAPPESRLAFHSGQNVLGAGELENNQWIWQEVIQLRFQCSEKWFHVGLSEYIFREISQN